MISFEEASFITAAKIVAAAEEITNQLSTRAKAVVKYLGTNASELKELRENGQILAWDVYQPRIIDEIAVVVSDIDGENIVILDWNQFYVNYSHVEMTLEAFLEIESRLVL